MGLQTFQISNKVGEWIGNRSHVRHGQISLLYFVQESLKGNAKTSLVVAVANAQEHADETLQSLQFGSRAMHVQIKAVVNESVGSKLLNADLLARLANMEVSTCLVDASLLAKEEELEKIQEALQVLHRFSHHCVVYMYTLRNSGNNGDVQEAQHKIIVQYCSSSNSEVDFMPRRNPLE